MECGFERIASGHSRTIRTLTGISELRLHCKLRNQDRFRPIVLKKSSVFSGNRDSIDKLGISMELVDDG